MGLALLVFMMFLDVLVAPGSRVLGNGATDLFHQFLSWRAFGFGELAKGNLPLWNPHIFSGAPYFGGMQSALLYPPNWLFMVLPLPLAVNWTIALDFWLLGAFMFLWALRRGLEPLAAFLAGALQMFCAPHFLHLHAGHLPHLSAMAWAPLLFLAMDEWLRSGRFGWCLLGMLAVAVQLLSGHPQYVLYTAIAAGGYAAIRILLAEDGRLRSAAGLLTLHPGGALLAAIQLFTAYQAASETVRNQPLPYAMASMFGFPAENLLTLLAPGFFGDMTTHPYWGRGYLWEASLFIGVLGLALAVYGMLRGRTAGKAALVTMIPVTLLLALGDDTPLWGVLYEYVPGFDRFRGTSKFAFQSSLFLVMFSAVGLDHLLRRREPDRKAILCGALAVAALCAGAAALQLADWQAVLRSVHASGQTYLADGAFGDPRFASAAQAFASNGLLLSGLVLAVALLPLAVMRTNRRAAAVVAALAIAETFVFARIGRDTFDSSSVVPTSLLKLRTHHADDFRVMNPINPNSAMLAGALDVWGYDPGVVRRYAELMLWTQGEDPAAASQYLEFRRFHRLLAMFRLQYVLPSAGGEAIPVHADLPALGRLELVGSHRVIAGRDAIFRALGADSFDPRREVVLEREPRPAPGGDPRPGRVRIVREGSDFMEIEAELASPAVLLITDAWTPSWRAVASDELDPRRYEILPANYALRAIPLAAGSHRLRLEYAPLAFRIGLWTSVAAWVAWAACVAIARRGSRSGARDSHA
jgi:hypothetical protein